jgi:hypothetical protein
MDNDLSQSSMFKHYPKTGKPRDWATRGIYIPLEHSYFNCARLKWLPSGEADIVLAPQNFGGSYYVIPLKYFASHAKFSSADKTLLHYIEIARPNNPIEMRNLATRIRAEQQKIPNPNVARRQACYVRAMNTLGASLAGQVGAAQTSAVIARNDCEMPNAVGSTKRQTIAGIDDADFVLRLDCWVDSVQTTEPEMVATLAAFNSQINSWIGATKWSDANLLRPLLADVRTALARTTEHLQFFSRFETNPLSEIVTERHLEASARAIRLAWLLDGWRFAFAVLDRANQAAIPIEEIASEIARLIPLLPSDIETLATQESLSALDFLGKAKTERTAVSLVKTVKAGQDWLTGLSETDALRLAVARRRTNHVPEPVK